MNEKNTETRIRIAAARCLLGDVVRYDAQEKRDHFIADTLGRHFQWSMICPEVEIGLGVPRPKIQLQRTGDGNAMREFRLVMPQGNRDLTRKMLAYARRLVRRLQKEGISGCLLKSRSPSCGLSRVKTYSSNGHMRREGIGLFAKTLLEMLPDLPVEEDERLHDPLVRDNWIERVFAYNRLQRLFTSRCMLADLTAFHDAHKLVLLSHSPKAFGDLSRFLDGVGSLDGAKATSSSRLSSQVRGRYGSAFMAALRRPATRAKNAAVLRRILVQLKPGLDTATHRHLAERIADYRRDRNNTGLPLVVPKTLLAHFAKILDVDELRNQTYLWPTAAELALLNHA